MIFSCLTVKTAPPPTLLRCTVRLNYTFSKSEGTNQEQDKVTKCQFLIFACLLVSRQWITAMNTRSHPHYVESGWTRQDSEGQFNEIWGVSEWAQTLFRNNTTSAPTPASYPTMISQINQPDQDKSHRQEKLGEFETNRKYFTSGSTSRCLSGVVNNFKSFDSDFISFWVVYVYVSMHVSPLSSLSLFLSLTLSPPHPHPNPPPCLSCILWFHRGANRLSPKYDPSPPPHPSCSFFPSSRFEWNVL